MGQLEEIVDCSDDLVKEFTELNYDTLGNITKRYIYTRSKADKGEVYDIQDVTYNYGVDPDSDEDGKSEAGWNRLLTSITTINYIDGIAQESVKEYIDYDEIGNPILYLGANLTWNGRQLTGYGKDNTSVLYTYDANGLRTSKTVAKMGKTTVGGIEIPCVEEQTETKYYYVNGNLHYEERSNGTKLYFFYDSNGYLTGIEYNNTMYYPATNRRGDVVAIYDSNGSCVAKYEYDAWGKVISVTDGEDVEITDQSHIAHINPIRYRGYYYDTETKLYYLQSRYYNPGVGRFLNADVQLNDDILGNNTFAYCSNNPTTRSDTSGQGWWIPACALIGGLTSAASVIASNIITGEKWYSGAVGAFAGGAVGGAIFAITGSSLLSSAASAYISTAVESTVNEVLSYTKVSELSGSKQKILTSNNIANSVFNIGFNTVIDGTVNLAVGEIAGTLIPTGNWIKPKKFLTSFFGKYAAKVTGQACIQANINTWTNVTYSYLSVKYNDGQSPTIQLFPETYVE